MLDNFEHLLFPLDPPDKQVSPDGVALVAEILETAPEVRILVTSRERLNLQEEQVFAIDGLTFPDRGSAAPVDGLDDAVGYTAIQLFLQAAQRNQQDFDLETDDERLALVQICQLVDGMPLALELAASWVDTCLYRILQPKFSTVSTCWKPSCAICRPDTAACEPPLIIPGGNWMKGNNRSSPNSPSFGVDLPGRLPRQSQEQRCGSYPGW